MVWVPYERERNNGWFFNVVITLRVMSCRHGGA
jgi:hypothetical protein